MKKVQFTAYDRENCPLRLDPAYYLFYETVKTGLSEEICEYVYKNEKGYMTKDEVIQELQQTLSQKEVEAKSNAIFATTEHELLMASDRKCEEYEKRLKNSEMTIHAWSEIFSYELNGEKVFMPPQAVKAILSSYRTGLENARDNIVLSITGLIFVKAEDDASIMNIQKVDQYLKETLHHLNKLMGGEA